MGSDLPTGEGMEFDADSFVTLDKLTQFNSVVVPVVVVDPQRIQCVGTAFNISPDGVWVTARHVIDWAIELVAKRPGAYIAVLWVGSGEAEDVPDLLGGIANVSHFTKDDDVCKWALISEESCKGWLNVIELLENFQLESISYDVLGRLLERLMTRMSG